jgi:hypothetical protein
MAAPSFGLWSAGAVVYQSPASRFAAASLGRGDAPASSAASTGAPLACECGTRIRGASAMHIGEAVPIRDRAGNIVGSIETQQNGDQVLRNTESEIRGYYDAKGDFTRDAEQNIVAKGNKLRSMIC